MITVTQCEVITDIQCGDIADTQCYVITVTQCRKVIDTQCYGPVVVASSPIVANRKDVVFDE